MKYIQRVSETKEIMDKMYSSLDSFYTRIAKNRPRATDPRGRTPNTVKTSYQLLPPANEVARRGNVFTSVCQLYCPRDGGLYPSMHLGRGVYHRMHLGRGCGQGVSVHILLECILVEVYNFILLVLQCFF